MKLEIFDGQDDPTVYLVLHRASDGIALMCAHPDEDPWEQGAILTVRNDGTVMIWSDLGVPGFQTDDDGQVITKFAKQEAEEASR